MATLYQASLIPHVLCRTCQMGRCPWMVFWGAAPVWRGWHCHPSLRSKRYGYMGLALARPIDVQTLSLVHVATQSQLHNWQACISHVCNKQLTHGSSIKKVSISGFYTRFLMKKQWCLCQKCTSQQYNVRDQCLVALSQLWLYVDSTYQFCAWLGTWYTTSTPGSAQGSKNMECPGCLPETLR